jgi:hypothetical protein
MAALHRPRRPDLPAQRIERLRTTKVRVIAILDDSARRGIAGLTEVPGLALRLAVADIDAPAALAALDPHEPDKPDGALFGAAVSASLVPELVRTPVSRGAIYRRCRRSTRPPTGVATRPATAVPPGRAPPQQ